MGYQLTEILNRCTKEDADFLIATIDSYISFTDDEGLKEINDTWDGTGTIPLALNRKLEKEIRYLGSNDVAYMTRKLRGYEPAGIGIDEMIDDLCELLNLNISTARTLEARLEIFCGDVVDQQFSRLSDKRKREILEGMNFDKHHRQEILDRVITHKEMLLPVILPLLKGTLGPEVFQALIIAILAPFIGTEAAKAILAQIIARIPGTTWLGPLAMGASVGWIMLDLLGPASRKTLPLILYLGILCLRDGQTKEFEENLHK